MIESEVLNLVTLKKSTVVLQRVVDYPVVKLCGFLTFIDFTLMMNEISACHYLIWLGIATFRREISNK